MSSAKERLVRGIFSFVENLAKGMSTFRELLRRDWAAFGRFDERIEPILAVYVVGLIGILVGLISGLNQYPEISDQIKQLKDPFFRATPVDWAMHLIIFTGLFILFKIPAFAFKSTSWNALAAIALFLCYFPIAALLMTAAAFLILVTMRAFLQTTEGSLFFLAMMVLFLVVIDWMADPAKWEARRERAIRWAKGKVSKH